MSTTRAKFENGSFALDRSGNSRMNTSKEDPSEKLVPPGRDAVPAQLHKRTISSEDILAGEKEIWIQHGEAIYRLCETKSGKLILQK